MEPALCTDTARLGCRGEGGMPLSLARAALGVAATGRGLCGRRFAPVDEAAGPCLASGPAPYTDTARGEGDWRGEVGGDAGGTEGGARGCGASTGDGDEGVELAEAA